MSHDYSNCFCPPHSVYSLMFLIILVCSSWVSLFYGCVLLNSGPRVFIFLIILICLSCVSLFYRYVLSLNSGPLIFKKIFNIFFIILICLSWVSVFYRYVLSLNSGPLIFWFFFYHINLFAVSISVLQVCVVVKLWSSDVFDHFNWFVVSISVLCACVVVRRALTPVHWCFWSFKFFGHEDHCFTGMYFTGTYGF